MQPNPTQPSQAAREAAAAAVIEADGRTLDIRMGDADDLAVVQAFARFERDTEKRVRESLAGPCQVCGNPNRSHHSHLAPFDDSYHEFQPSLAGEANVERVVREAVELCKLIEKKLVPSLRPHITEAVVRLRAALTTLGRTTDAG